MTLLLLSVPLLSQDKDLLAQSVSLHDQGKESFDQGKYQEAASLFEKAAEIREGLGETSAYLAYLLDYIAVCYEHLQDYSKATEYYQREMQVREKVYGKTHPDNANKWKRIAFCHEKKGNYAQALDCYNQLLEVLAENVGIEHPDFADGINRMGICYYFLGEYSTALRYYSRALVIWEREFGKESSYYALGLNNMGICYKYLGDYANALDYYQRSLAIREKTLGNRHPLYASTLTNIGNCYWDLGDTARFFEYTQRALEILEKLGKKTVEYASTLHSLGLYFYTLKDYEKALEYYEKALTVFASIYGDRHPLYAPTLFNCGNCYEGLEKYREALEYYQQALGIYLKSFGEWHPDVANCLNSIGNCYRSLDDYGNALECHLEALSIKRKTIGENHPHYATSLKNTWLCYYEVGDYPKATKYIISYSNLISSLMTRSFPFLTESQRALYWNKYSYFYTDRLFSLTSAIQTSDMTCTAYDGALFGKGLLLNAETEMRKMILDSGNEEALKLFNEMQADRKELDRLYSNSIDQKARIDSLNGALERRQRDLMKINPAYSDYVRNLSIKWTDVQSSLSSNDISIEFESYTRKQKTYYIALTLRPGYSEPHLIELFDSDDLARIKPSQYYASWEMTNLIWGKLSNELKGVQNIYFSPVGELNNIGIEFLLDKDGKHHLSEKHNYYRLTSTREVAKSHISEPMKQAVVYGGIRYAAPFAASDKTRIVGDVPTSRIGWSYLPGTKTEADAISAILTSRGVTTTLLEEEKGTEESFKALNGKKTNVIHIATHGFYWMEGQAVQNTKETSSSMNDSDDQALKEDLALTRSGLLFAGAQNVFDGKEIPIDAEDGILTAKDISRMDLRGTDLVVLSACQSGLGEVTGDGVFGLQRGFKKAGVQSIVMSLWEVDDEAAQIMMTRFYENLVKGQSKYTAFREAQKYLRKYDNGIFNSPEYYAAFVLLDANGR